MWTGTMTPHSLQAAVWLINLVTADCRDSRGPLLRLPLSGTGWALLWYFTLRAWLCTPAGSLTVLYSYTLCTSGMPSTHVYRLRKNLYLLDIFSHLCISGRWCQNIKHFSFRFICWNLLTLSLVSEFYRMNWMEDPIFLPNTMLKTEGREGWYHSLISFSQPAAVFLLWKTVHGKSTWKLMEETNESLPVSSWSILAE